MKRPQRRPQPPPNYTSFGAVPDGFITWNASRYELHIVIDRHGADCFSYVKLRCGTVQLGGKTRRETVRLAGRLTAKHRLN